MSTILDALRKVEEENQARSADARARLLLSPTRTSLRSRQRQRVSWGIGVGFVLAGFAAGAGVMLWSPRAKSIEKTTIVQTADSNSNPDKGSHPAAAAPAQPAAQHLAQTTTEETPARGTPAPTMQPAGREAATDLPAVTQELPVPASSPIEDSSDESLAMETQREAPDAPLPGASAVQRSPFVASSPAPRESPVVAKHTPPAQPPSANPKAQDGTLSEVLLPSGAIVPAKPPAPAPVNVSAPTDTVLSFLQWSSDPDKRIAFIRVSGGPLMLAHEGDTVGGYTVVEIHQDAVDLRSGEAVMTLRVR